MADQEERTPEKNAEADAEAEEAPEAGGDAEESDTETEKVAGTEPNEGAWNPTEDGETS